MTVEVIEPALRGQNSFSHVRVATLADQRCAVAGRLQSCGQQTLVGEQAEPAVPLNLQGLETVAHGVASGHHRGPRLGREGLHVELLEPHARRGQLVERGC
jgi:hypothetical protein